MEQERFVQIPKSHLPATITSIRVTPGQELRKGDVICIYDHMVSIDGTEDNDNAMVVMDKLLNLKTDDKHRRNREILYSSYDGNVNSVNVKENQTVTDQKTHIIKLIEPCSHAIQYNGLCTICGKDLTSNDYFGDETQRATINMSYDASGLRVSVDEARRLEKKTAKRLQQSKKLSLIVDLDQTIIHAFASQDPRFESWLIENYKGPSTENGRKNSFAPKEETKEEKGEQEPPKGKPTLPSDIGTFYLPDSPLRYYIKLRPTLNEFLARVTEMYELHIYTMGTRHYAEAVANLIDPERKYFHERILSRDESGSLTQKNIRRLFPCDTSMVIVLDDRADVWQWSPNLIKVLPYSFFSGVGDINADHLPKNQNAIPSPESVKPKEGEKSKALVDNDRELRVILGVLTTIHEEYYESLRVYKELEDSDSDEEEEEEDGGEDGVEDSPDVTAILSILKNNVLLGTHIVFSAVIPINSGAPPPQHSDIWRWATDFGAKCQLEIDDKTTHIVTGRPGTEKVHQARRVNRTRAQNNKQPIQIVPVSWLLNSISRWVRLDEKPYLLYPEKSETPAAAATPSSVPGDEQPPQDVLERVDSFVIHGDKEQQQQDQQPPQPTRSGRTTTTPPTPRGGVGRSDTDIELEREERSFEMPEEELQAKLNQISHEGMTEHGDVAGVDSTEQKSRRRHSTMVDSSGNDDSSDSNASASSPTMSRRSGGNLKRRRVIPSARGHFSRLSGSKLVGDGTINLDVGDEESDVFEDFEATNNGEKKSGYQEDSEDDGDGRAEDDDEEEEKAENEFTFEASDDESGDDGFGDDDDEDDLLQDFANELDNELSSS